MFKRLPTFKSLPQAIGLPFLSSQEDAQLKFRSGENGIKRLYGDEIIPQSDVGYWSQYYTLFNSTQDVYSLISAQDVRQALMAQPDNLATLIFYLSHHLFTLLPSPLFPTTKITPQGQDPTREALNCLRVLGRLIVIVYEAEANAREGGVSTGEAFARDHLWSRKPALRGTDGRLLDGQLASAPTSPVGPNGAAQSGEESQFTIADSDEEDDNTLEKGKAAAKDGDDAKKGAGPSDVVNGSDPLSNDAPSPSTPQQPSTDSADLLPSLIDRLFTCTIDLLFCAGFTVPDSVRGQSAEGEKINYVIWDKGVGSTVSVGSTAEYDRHKVEVLRFLMILLSGTIYTPPHAIPTTPNLPLSHLTHSLERRLVLSLLCSLLNTSLQTTKQNTVGQIPYTHLISKAAEEKRTLVRSCLMTLLVALDYQEMKREGEMGEGKEENAFRYFVSKLHRKEDFSFILNGVFAVLEEQTAVSAAYLPGSKRPVPYLLEVFMLLWRLVDLNKRFRQYLYDSNRTSDLIAYILLTSLDLKDDPSNHGLLRLLAYLLQNLSADQAFGQSLVQSVRLNIPAKWAVAGTTADLLIVSIYSIATTPGLNPLFPALTITIANVAPHWKGIGVQASTRLMQLFKAFSAPNFLLADEGHPRLVYYLLETFNSILYYQLNENPNLVYAILKSHQDVQTLATFTLVSGLREIQRRKALRAAAAEAAAAKNPESPGLKRTNSELDMLAEKAALLGREVGDENETDTGSGEQRVQAIITSPGLDSSNDPLSTVPLAVPTPEPQSPPDNVDRSASAIGMSEKARGKMKATESTTSLPLVSPENEVPDEELMKVAAAGVGPNGYVPTQEWVASWQKGLPLDPVLLAISELLPKMQDSQSQSTSGAPSSKVFRLLKEVDLSEVLPPAPPISPRRFQWSSASSIWLTSLLWGDIYVAGLTSVGVWRDTTVRLFGIKQAPVKGRSAQVGRVLKMIGVA